MDLGDLVRIGVGILVFLAIGWTGRCSGTGALPASQPAGELRVKIVYRCAVCGTEVRMTMANDEYEPPRRAWTRWNWSARPSNPQGGDCPGESHLL